jgi:hypothetical protein
MTCHQAVTASVGEGAGVVAVVIGVVFVIGGLLCEPLDSRGSSLVELDVETHPGELVPGEGAQRSDVRADAAEVELL